MTDPVRETLVMTKRRIRQGQWWEITAEASWADMGGGTIRGEVTSTFDQRFYFRHALGTENIRWPRKSEVTVDSDGVIRLGGPRPMTLVRVHGPGDDAWRLIDEIASTPAGTDDGDLKVQAANWITRARSLRTAAHR